VEGHYLLKQHEEFMTIMGSSLEVQATQIPLPKVDEEKKEQLGVTHSHPSDEILMPELEGFEQQFGPIYII
jgi:hypothetical protein